MKTFNLKQNDIQKTWYLVDADGIVLGRLATMVATLLRGKHKPTYTPHLDCGDNVIVINAAKVAFKGNKAEKRYYRHTGYPGGIKEISLDKLLKTRPERAIMAAVKGMLTRNPLGRKQLKNLRVYAGNEHPHEAQTPVTYEIKQEASRG